MSDKCSICGMSDWHDLDYMRDREYWLDREYIDIDTAIGFRICKNCGYINYEYRPDGSLKDHYATDRKMVTFHHEITCNRKNNYHRAFLKDYLKPDMTFIDIGCAQGSMINMLVNEFGLKKDNVFGTEWGTAFVAYAKHWYGLNVEREIKPEWPKKYDMISYYHVLEHIQAPEIEMDKAREMLNDDGYLYVSVPTWLDMLDETSQQMVESFEFHYHLNHINVFTENTFENFLAVTGWKVVKIDKDMYGYTVLLQKTDKKTVGAIKKENYLENIEKLETQHRAIRAMAEKKNEEAISIWPKFPDAYLFWSMERQNMKEFKLAKDILEKGIALMPKNAKLISQLAKLYFQWDENTPERSGYYSNNIKLSERWFEKLRDIKGGVYEECDYFEALIEAKYKKDFRRAIDLMKNVTRLDPNKWSECTNYIAKFCDSLNKQQEKMK